MFFRNRDLNGEVQEDGANKPRGFMFQEPKEKQSEEADLVPDTDIDAEIEEDFNELEEELQQIDEIERCQTEDSANRDVFNSNGNSNPSRSNRHRSNFISNDRSVVERQSSNNSKRIFQDGNQQELRF
ncbi:hypothetical protein [Metabacillus iocasae]|uniref:Uncharacterized protein n=1 Tax=Priestia iocasae TaxID=2291674 RepID=A0ABS2QV45_9BACI|nr:hypothetical protein [Metabacillus iocasae]MBM7703307.1 hypothetical protein [Metabacillus iocasae]